MLHGISKREIQNTSVVLFYILTNDATRKSLFKSGYTKGDEGNF
jgi:hypothetical protein